MSDLLDLALQTHGDLERRREVCMHQLRKCAKPVPRRPSRWPARLSGTAYSTRRR
jgi:hypothetical protein